MHLLHPGQPAVIDMAHLGPPWHRSKLMIQSTWVLAIHLLVCVPSARLYRLMVVLASSKAVMLRCSLKIRDVAVLQGLLHQRSSCHHCRRHQPVAPQ